MEEIERNIEDEIKNCDHEFTRGLDGYCIKCERLKMDILSKTIIEIWDE